MKTFQKSWHLVFLMILVTIVGIRCSNDDEVKVEGPVKDVDGNEYETVTIGNQVWMAENLKVIHLNDDTSIPLVNDNTPWSSMDTQRDCAGMTTMRRRTRIYTGHYITGIP